MKAYELLDSPDKWTQGALARNVAGDPLCNVHSQNAVAWCLIGATWKCYREEGQERDEAMRSLVFVLSGALFDEWNDDSDRTYEEVIAVLKKADV